MTLATSSLGPAKFRNTSMGGVPNLTLQPFGIHIYVLGNSLVNKKTSSLNTVVIGLNLTLTER